MDELPPETASSYKGNDIDSDGDGKVDAAVQADNAAQADNADKFDGVDPSNGSAGQFLKTDGTNLVFGSTSGGTDLQWTKDGEWTSGSSYSLNNPSQEVLLVVKNVTSDDYGLKVNNQTGYDIIRTTGTATGANYVGIANQYERDSGIVHLDCSGARVSWAISIGSTSSGIPLSAVSTFNPSQINSIDANANIDGKIEVYTR